MNYKLAILISLSILAAVPIAYFTYKAASSDSFLKQSTAPYDAATMQIFKQFFLNNIDINGSGSVLASPSTSNPDYYYHWVRDAAISMKILLDTYGDSVYQHFYNYISMEITHQHDSDPNGINIIGEPKFYINGPVYDKPWGRPQDDSPALRAIAIMDFANQIYNTPSGLTFIQQYLYAADLSNPLAIKTDLEYVAHNWQESCFDLWEESNGDNFFTKMVQRKALIDGAAFATKMNDGGAATFYLQQVTLLENAINNHWDTTNNVIIATMPGYSGPRKYLNLDAAQFLGALYGDNNDNFYTPGSDRVLATAQALIDALKGVYPINAQDDSNNVPGFLVGRYPNDTYDGYKTGSIGNPWILTTNALGELHYRTALEIQSQGSRTVNNLNIGFFQRVLGNSNLSEGTVLQSSDVYNALMSAGDDFLLRIKYHIAGAGFACPEELNLNSGFEQGAVHLTWSYGTVISAMNTRSQM